MQLDKGPFEVLRALATGTEQEIAEALAFQRETFRTRFGCYPEECEVVDTWQEFYHTHGRWPQDGEIV